MNKLLRSDLSHQVGRMKSKSKRCHFRWAKRAIHSQWKRMRRHKPKGGNSVTFLVLFVASSNKKNTAGGDGETRTTEDRGLRRAGRDWNTSSLECNTFSSASMTSLDPCTRFTSSSSNSNSNNSSSSSSGGGGGGGSRLGEPIFKAQSGQLYIFSFL